MSRGYEITSPYERTKLPRLTHCASCLRALAHSPWHGWSGHAWDCIRIGEGPDSYDPRGGAR